MNFKQVEKSRWAEFLADFSRQHAGTPISIRSVGQPHGPAGVADRKLKSISLERTERGEQVSVVFQDNAGNELTDVFPKLSNVGELEAGEGQHGGVRIEGGGTGVDLVLRPPANRTIEERAA